MTRLSLAGGLRRSLTLALPRPTVDDVEVEDDRHRSRYTNMEVLVLAFDMNDGLAVTGE
jgi:hypothetical protein